MRAGNGGSEREIAPAAGRREEGLEEADAGRGDGLPDDGLRAAPPRSASEADGRSPEASGEPKSPEEGLPAEEGARESEPEQAWESPAEAFEPLDLDAKWASRDAAPEDVEAEFEPLDLDRFLQTDSPKREKASAPEECEISERLSRNLREEPVRLRAHMPDLSDVKPPQPERTGARRSANTRVPQKAFNPDDLFLDGGDEDDFDEDDSFEYEERERGGFFLRHVRGIVALSLTLLVLAIVAGWAMTDSGQRALAQANLAWRASAYDAVAFEDYQNGRYLRAAVNYERALSRDGGNYTYANTAAIAYYQADDAARSAEMAERAIEIDPTRTDAYEVLLRLYPDEETRPAEISALLQSGYRLTGEQSFDVG